MAKLLKYEEAIELILRHAMISFERDPSDPDQLREPLDVACKRHGIDAWPSYRDKLIAKHEQKVNQTSV